ncbi:Squalene epoxidase [Dispira parvispora]|uniref:Squalene monooxygenase n=1 Tax=Dispira parvispora TaxID=1520584 RepID=A0A9W8AN63_9FUNG|nr:Squalene epoxidase [Dispira parvispora]
MYGQDAPSQDALLLTPSSKDSNILQCHGTPVYQYDVIIVGGGVAGAALAYALGKDGRRVLMIERDLSEPDRFMGELLQPGGIEYLKQLHLESTLDGIDGRVIYGALTLVGEGQRLQRYPNRPDSGRPYCAIGFHHGRFVNNLRRAATELSTVTARQGVVSALIEEPGRGRVLGVSYIPSDSVPRDTVGNTGNLPGPLPAFAPLTVLANGGLSKFQRSYLPRLPTCNSCTYAITLRDCELPVPNHSCLVMSKLAPVVIYPISSHETRALVIVPHHVRKMYDNDIRRYLMEKVVPDIPETIRSKFIEGVEASSLRFMPNLYLPPSRCAHNGLLFLGDAFSTRHPVTGGGMTVALGDVVLLKQLLSPQVVPSLDDTRVVAARLRVFHWKRKLWSSAITILAQVYIQIMENQGDPDFSILGFALAEYFKLGGTASSTPVGLIGGVYTNPLLLLYHMNAVVIYGFYRFLISSDSPRTFIGNICRALSALWAGYNLVLPLVWAQLF